MWVYRVYKNAKQQVITMAVNIGDVSLTNVYVGDVVIAEIHIGSVQLYP